MARRVAGIGGVFFKARDPDRLRAWYREHLDLSPVLA
jgi:glyoxylase I family protein